MLHPLPLSIILCYVILPIALFDTYPWPCMHPLGKSISYMLFTDIASYEFEGSPNGTENDSRSCDLTLHF